MKYNLIRNGYFDSLTISGTGNLDLNWIQLETLMDGNLTSSGVVLTVPDNLYLEVDLSQRIKVDGIRLYASDLSKSSDIKFYYKNLESDSYAGLTTYSGASYYYTTIASPSAPRYMRVTVSGIAIELYEFQIFNDDYIVAFGEDGNQYSQYLDNTQVGEVGSPEIIKLFNNDTGVIPANAYACIDYTGTDGDWYVKISESENGAYYKLEDGGVIKDNNLSNTYIWDMGEYSGVLVDNDKLTLSGTGITQKLGHLPNGTAAEAFGTGSNTWDWDRANKKMYVMGLEGTALSLWDYDYILDGWNYLTNLAPAVAASPRFAVMSYCDGAIYVISKYDGTFGKYTISGSVDNWTNLPNPTFSGAVPIDNEDSVSMCSDGVRYIYALTTRRGEDTTNRNFRRFDTVSGTWSTMDDGYRQYNWAAGSSTAGQSSCVTYDYDKDRVYLVNASERYTDTGHYIQMYNVSSDSWGTTWFDITNVYNTMYVLEAIWYHNKYIYVSCSPYFDTGYFFRYNLDTTEVEKLNLGYVHYSSIQSNQVGVYIIAIDSESDFGASVYFAQIDSDREYLYGYNARGNLTGSYVSPVLKMADRYNSSYFIVDATTTSGLTSVSYDAGSYNGTIRVRSSNTEPLRIDEVYWGDGQNVYKYIIYNGAEDTGWASAPNALFTLYGVAVNRLNRNIGFSFRYINSNIRGGYEYVYNYDGALLYSYGSSSFGHEYKWVFNVNFEFDKDGGMWGYSNYAATKNNLMHINNTYDGTLYDFNDGTDFLYDLAVEMDGTGVWYTNQIDDILIHLDTDGTVLQTITLNEPRAVCGTLDNGCWVIDNDEEKAYRYNSSGNLVKIVNLGRAAFRMSTDMVDGFWYISDDQYHVYHVTSGGIEDVNVVLSKIDRVKGGYGGCIVWSSINDHVKYIDNSGNITRTFTIAGATDTNWPALLSFGYDNFVELQDTDNVMPISYDPIWGTNGSAEWREVRKDGYFLPKEQYHQVELTLRTSHLTYMPYVNKLLTAPAIKIQDIIPQSSKDMYIRTDIPATVDIEDYETKICCWWGIEE